MAVHTRRYKLDRLREPPGFCSPDLQLLRLAFYESGVDIPECPLTGVGVHSAASRFRFARPAFQRDRLNYGSLSRSVFELVS